MILYRKVKILSPLRGLKKKKSYSFRGLTHPGYETYDPFGV
jgi:hypothetical protein